MARTQIPVTVPGHTALTADPALTNSDQTNGMYVNNDGYTVLRISNTNAATRNVTLNYGNTYDGQAIPAVVLTVPASPGVIWYKLGPVGLWGTPINLDFTGANGDLKIQAISATG